MLCQARRRAGSVASGADTRPGEQHHLQHRRQRTYALADDSTTIRGQRIAIPRFPGSAIRVPGYVMGLAAYPRVSAAGTQ